MSQQIVKVNLEKFLRTGIFGAIEFGLTSDQIINLLSEPDSVLTHSKTKKPLGFKYGDAELHFVSSKDKRLRAIYFDEFTVPKGNKLLQIDGCFLRAAMPQFEVETILTRLNIKFEATEMPTPTMNGIITQGGVVLGFIKEADEFSPPIGLYNITRVISV